RRLVKLCRWLSSQNVALVLFGTTSEANSLSLEEKISLLNDLIDAEINPSLLMPGTGCCSLTETVQLTSHAVKLGCKGTLMLPPFFYKDINDDGLFRSYAETIERVGDSALKIYLYHIPPVSGVNISLDLIERLVIRYPNTIVGVKDSSGNWENTQSILERQLDDFRVFAGSEHFLLQTMRAGGAGCISATANINPNAIYNLYKEWKSNQADDLQKQLNQVRATLESYPMIPALKSVVSYYSNHPDWTIVRPPFISLEKETQKELIQKLKSLGFVMPNLD
ncbi:MAG: dihydrodipicolinate synthase family protein, partial [Candidatus Neomarinimicrobiota bacterium]|nr:dihydrodipicolinate synthase family protein [Candidatus Neomarinimicrobiota bacterium]